MSLKNGFGIYQVIERLLKQSKRPLTCVELFDAPEVRQHASDTNKVSDYLGHMHRRGLLDKHPAPKGMGAARYAYSWKDPNVGSPIVPRATHNRLQVVNLKERDERLAMLEAATRGVTTGKVLAERPAYRVVEENDSLVIDTLHFRLTLQAK
jgi:hypothetical protein